MPRRLALLPLTVLLASGSAQVSPPSSKVTAQDVFDEVIYELAQGYTGPSTVRASDLRRRFLPELQKACAGKTFCAAENAYPIIRNVLKELGDKHTNFFTPAQLEDVSRLFSGEAGSRNSFGMASDALGAGGRVVLDVVQDTPADKAGVQVGDVLLRVNGVALDGEAGADALRRVSRGTPATFDVRRQGQMRKVTMSARPLVTPPVTLNVIDGVGILRLRHFNVPGVGQQVHDLVTSAQKQKVKGLVLDLRYNPGGRVEEFLLTAGAFTTPEPFTLASRIDSATLRYDTGKYVVNDAVQNALTVKNPARYQGPLVVLIDRDTASSAEFLTRTLLTRPCTAVIGEATAGVGDTATRFIDLLDGSGLQLTFAQLFDASGQKLREQVEPQYKIDLSSALIAKQGRDVPLAEAIKRLPEPRGCVKATG